MRLICPNCGAQYEVADDVIPEEGRDVQCSNCAHTWFEAPQAAGIESAFADVSPAADYQPDPTPSPAAAPQRQELDPAIADILREEAAREEAAKQAETASAFQSQPTLGIDNGAAVSPRPVPTRPTQDDAPRVATFDAAPASKTLLPDIEEINSSLRPDANRIDIGTVDPVATDGKSRSGFRLGFLIVILVILLLAVAYVFAADIAALVPQLAESLSNYVAQVDEWRLAFDAWVQSITGAQS